MEDYTGQAFVLCSIPIVLVLGTFYFRDVQPTRPTNYSAYKACLFHLLRVSAKLFSYPIPHNFLDAQVGK